MRFPALLLIVLVLATGCRTEEERARRNLEDAEEQLEEARERLAEMREDAGDEIEEARRAIRDARDQFEDIQHGWSDDAREQAEEALEDAGVGEAIGALFEEVGRAMQGDSDVQPVDARKLVDLLPEDVEGFRLKNTNRDNTRALGIRLSHVKADYDGGGGSEMQIAIVDLGSLKGAASRAFDELDLHVDRESGDEYERTTEFQGYPGHLRVREHSRKTAVEATVFVGDRFIVHVEADGRDIDEDLIDRVLREIGLRRLERLG